MDAETSAMVEALYASGKVERPTWNRCGLRWCATDDDWYWCVSPPLCDGDSAESPESVIGWDLVQALAKVRKILCPLEDDRWRVCGTDGSGVWVFEKAHACPIRAMAEALNGGG